MSLVTPGTAIERADLLALAQRAADIGCTGAYGDYPFHPIGGVDAPHWLTDLTNLHRDVVGRAMALCNPELASPLAPSIGCVSGPWIIPPGHPAFWVWGWGGPVLSFGGGDGIGPNLGRRAVGVKLWSRGVVTPLRIMTQIAPVFEFELDGETTVPASSSASWGYTRTAKTAGAFFVSVQVADTTTPETVDITFSGSPSALDVSTWGGGPVVTWLYDDESAVSHYSVSLSKRASWGTCLNGHESWGDGLGLAGNGDIYDRETGVSGDSIEVGYTVTGMTSEADYVVLSKGYSNSLDAGFAVSAHYGETTGDYPACEKPCVSNEAWFVSEENPVFMVTGDVRVNGVRRSGFENIGWIWADAYPPDPNNPPELHWEAKLWPVGWMRRSNSYAFPGQAAASGGQSVAVPLRASDGLWVQSDQVAEVEMDGVERLQPTATVVGGAEPCPVAIDFVSLTRRQPYGAKPEISVDLKCWRGTGGSRALVTLVNVKLPAGEIHKRVNLSELLPVFDSISIAHSNADLVTVRLGNRKAIGQIWWDIPGPPYILYAVGQISPEGVPADLVNDLVRICDAIDPP